MAKEKHKEEAFACPVGRFFMEFQKTSKGKSKFHDHLNQSRIEFLRAVRSLVDERIDKLEKEAHAGEGKKATRIKVE
ncbi:MAG: hypothetical protein JXL84_24980 [Deltaproteobacteria bacterium]|nr:hypothetical protein [Deltaproteobacteria bacterium]